MRKSLTQVWSISLTFVFGIALFVWAEEPFDYFENSWALIGLQDYARGTRISPDNKLLIGATVGTSEGEADKASVQIRFGRELTPLSRAQTKQLMDGWFPVVLLTAVDESIHYVFTFWATPLPSVSDWEKAFAWPSEGENFLNWIAVRVTNSGAAVAKAKLRIEQPGPYEASAHPVPTLATPRDSTWSLAPGESVVCSVALPWEPVEADYADEDAAIWLERTVAYWRGVIADAVSIEVPCEKATQAYRAAHVCQLISSDHGELHGGEGFYDEFYIRDGAYQVMELEEAGLWNAARKAIDVYLAHQRDDGRFESQKNQFDANGQALWALWQYYKITGDRAWLERAYPQMRRAVNWITQARRLAPADSPFAGLLPNAPADGEFLWDGDHHIVGYDFWNLRGLLCTADAARALGRSDEAESLLKEADAYRKAIDAAWERTGLPHFPPSWEKDGTHWGDTETLWPTPIVSADDPRVAALNEEVREQHLGGFIEGTIQWQGGDMRDAIHPYMSAYTTMASLVRGEHEKVVEEFYWYLLHSTATHGFPEGIFYKRRFAWSNTIPHVTGASNYALLFRHMLIHEQGDELHLLKAIPDWWLDPGKEIDIERAPTHFGPMALHVRGTDTGVEVEFDAPKHEVPKRVVLYLPESRPLAQSVEEIEVEARSTQGTRWDFGATISRYRSPK